MYNKCKQSITPTVNEEFAPVDFILTTEVLEEDSRKTQDEINQELRGEIKSLKRMLTLIQKQIDESI